MCCCTGAHTTLHCCYTHGTLIRWVLTHVCACVCFLRPLCFQKPTSKQHNCKSLFTAVAELQAALAQERAINEQGTMQLEALQKKYAQLERKHAESQTEELKLNNRILHQNVELEYIRANYATQEPQVLVSLCSACCASSMKFDLLVHFAATLPLAKYPDYVCMA